MTRPAGPPDAADYDSGIDAVLIAAASAPDRLAVALAVLRGRVVGRLDWQAAFGDHATPHVIVVEAAGVDLALLAERLPVIVDQAAALQAGLVVALGMDEIDVVAAATLGGSTRLLVDPTVGDCVAAIVVAAEAARLPAGVFDVTRETDSTRLERLNTEVARIAEALARLTRAEIDEDTPAAPIVGDRTNHYGARPSLAEPSAADVRRAIRARRLRDQFFGTALFEDPGWDMLLDLYAAELERGRVSVSSLCIAAAVAPTTALRWIARMTDTGLFERRPDMHDRRRAFMVLSDRASEAMRGYIVATRGADLRIP
ncbi:MULTISPECIES: MarR family winged helix-turn-helix transcriptional regulator [Sphingomonas]|uniref:MarR family winged helix-turn-helix transcriptional regulator n=1 Tax=Sphingomonas TaxID=13687 RepID=UPI0020C02392|nr:MarR family winged helix-turn-helix transcriptional regulator [Sphingomonas faeni]MCK8458430.1 MarR family winged helix-turn-helix transcriptional regulator [Sphingomonas faeni]